MTTVRASMKLKFDSVHAWSDSTVTLDWIRGQPSQWKTFVANRITEIHEHLPADLWGHVSGDINPADCASRGIDPTELRDHPLWWSGPTWLHHGIASLSKPRPSSPDVVCLEERKPRVCANVAMQQDENVLIYKYSSFQRLKHITGWCKRFIYNCKIKSISKPDGRRCGPLTPEELLDALMIWVIISQHQSFPLEMQSLSVGKPVSHKSRIRSLNPFIDPFGILRVGGRLRHAVIPMEKKHPILIPRHHRLTELLIMSIHINNYHAGPQLIQSILSSQFWIVNARDAIRHRVKKCVTCTRFAAKTLQTFMGDLPVARVNPARPFEECGVDYAGFFLMKPISPRSKITYKAYLALFICLTTRAVHLELVSSLSTDAFLATFRRFIARCGKPKNMYSDAGTNFVGAAREIKEMIALIASSSHNNKVAANLGDEGIKWNFNPPGAPHFGGLWEAGVKSVKHHLHRVVGSARLTFEELTTVFAQIEACLNSRPLTPFSSDPDDLNALTPGHFLIGVPMTAAPDVDVATHPVGRLDRWQLLQQMYQSFWNRWSNEFITRLQQRPKWMNHSAEIKVGSMVLIKDERLPPLKWRLGRVTATHPGADGVIRVLSIKTADGDIKRPLVKLCLLPIDSVIDNSSDTV